MLANPRLWRFQLLAMFAVAVSGCSKGPAGPPQAPPPPKVTVVKPVTYPVQKYFEYNGYLEATATNEIRARVKGFLDEVHFTEGVEVEKGAPLYTIDPRQYAATVAKSRADIAKAVADMASATAQITLAQANLDRFKASGSGASKSETDQAQATLESNKASYNVAVANKSSAEAALQTAELELSYTIIKAPIAGRIGRTLVTKGNLVGQNDATLLATIVSVDPIYAYFDTPEKDLVAYQQSTESGGDGKAMLQSIPIELGIANEQGYPHKGTLDFRDNKVDTGTGTIKLRASVPNPVVQPRNIRLLYPGLYTRIRVPNGPVQQQLTIPEEALMTGQEGRFVYVIGEENKVMKRTVTVGANVWRAPERNAEAPPPGWSLNNPKPPDPAPPGAPPGPPPPTNLPSRSIIAIEQGLKEGDQVIVIGLQKARPGSPVTPDLWDLTPPPKK